MRCADLQRWGRLKYTCCGFAEYKSIPTGDIFRDMSMNAGAAHCKAANVLTRRQMNFDALSDFIPSVGLREKVSYPRFYKPCLRFAATFAFLNQCDQIKRRHCQKNVTEQSLTHIR